MVSSASLPVLEASWFSPTGAGAVAFACAIVSSPSTCRTEGEEEEGDRCTARLCFDIAVLAGRLADATDWLVSRRETGNMAVGYFGASTTTALVGGAERPYIVRAGVSRGGRPDLAGLALTRVRAPPTFSKSL